MNIIIYGSHYGTAKKYAEELARRICYELKSYEDIRDIDCYSTIIYIGSLYAGGVLGMKKTFEKMKDCGNKRIIIATVGLADPTNEKNTDNIKNAMKKQLPEEIYDSAHIFHLRGGIDYSKLNLKHKVMMGLLYRKIKSLPEEKKTEEEKAMIKTYKQRVDFVDYECLYQIIQDI
ncbi:MAG: flavodoxin domain-containing protein [Euryarchaeota archaeon]|nr:flavodoxin domain-containing protein [Euryarchaeota archaeon]